MALFTNSYSGLITGGLGMPACCGMLTMGFHVFKCTIEITPIPIPSSGGGGHHVQVRNVPLDLHKQRNVTITVTLKGKTWKHTNMVTERKATIIVKAINIVNRARRTVSAVASNVARVGRSISAIFTDTDK